MVGGLANLVRQAKVKGTLKGIAMGNKGVKVNMLQFNDDLLFICQADSGNLLVIK